MSTRKKLRRELRYAYARLNKTGYEESYGEHQFAIGRYQGLRKAYAIITGLDELAIGYQDASWYVRSRIYNHPASTDQENTTP